jgi:hypothetical protein
VHVREFSASAEVLKPEADRVGTSRPRAERFERTDVEDGIVGREYDVQKRRGGRDADAVQIEERRDAFRFVGRA